MQEYDKYIARPDKKDESGQITKMGQSVYEHSCNVSDISKEMAEKFNMKKVGEILGEYHDLGKYTNIFQGHIRGVSGSRDKVGHAIYGGKHLINIKNKLNEILAIPMLSHHTGLQDWVSPENGRDMEKRIKEFIEAGKDKEIERIMEIYKKENKNTIEHKYNISFKDLFEEYKNSLSQYKKKFLDKNTIFYNYTLIHILTSVLVDADRLDAENFYEENSFNIRNQYNTITNLSQRLNDFLDKKYLNNKENKNKKINIDRNNILINCRKEGKKKNKGFYLLEVPTGLGKTFAVSSLALNLAKQYNKDRIHYILPFTSIIEQTGDVLRKILDTNNENNILEHYYVHDHKYDVDNRNITDGEKEYILNKYEKASENLDMPIVITTIVKFFESFFSYSTTQLRCLHNFTNSVVIFDEFQKIPINFIKPCLMLLSILEKYFGVIFIFSTATQPQLQKQFKECGIKCHKVIKDYEKYFNKYKRVKTVNLKENTFDEISNKLINEKNNYLCVVNTRKIARDIYKKITAHHKKSEGIYLLSNYKIPIDKYEVIKEINLRLEKKLKCIVISTSCIEAGVDMDFPVVYSEICGVDSLVQRAGRCNREGLLKKGMFYIFKFSDRPLPSYGSVSAKIAQKLFDKDKIDITSLNVIIKYYKTLYSMKSKEDFDKNDIIKKIEDDCTGCNFKSIKKGIKNEKGEYKGGFNLIPDNEYHIIVNYDEEANNLLEELKQGKINRNNMRKIQKYIVNIYKNDFDKIQSKLHNIEWNKDDNKIKGLLNDSDLYYVNRDCYNKDIGLIVDNIVEEEEH